MCYIFNIYYIITTIRHYTCKILGFWLLKKNLASLYISNTRPQNPRPATGSNTLHQPTSRWRIHIQLDLSRSTTFSEGPCIPILPDATLGQDSQSMCQIGAVSSHGQQPLFNIYDMVAHTSYLEQDQVFAQEIMADIFFHKSTESSPTNFNFKEQMNTTKESRNPQMCT